MENIKQKQTQIGAPQGTINVGPPQGDKSAQQYFHNYKTYRSWGRGAPNPKSQLTGWFSAFPVQLFFYIANDLARFEQKKCKLGKNVGKRNEMTENE